MINRECRRSIYRALRACEGGGAENAVSTSDSMSNERIVVNSRASASMLIASENKSGGLLRAEYLSLVTAQLVRAQNAPFLILDHCDILLLDS